MKMFIDRTFQGTSVFELFMSFLIVAGVLSACGSTTIKTDEDKKEEPVQIVEATVDTSTAYQTIVGFGGYRPEDQAEKVVKDLGLTITRLGISPAFKESEESSYDFIAANDFNGGIEPLEDLKSLGIRKFIATAWTPPAWMKENNSETGAGDPENRLLASRYDDYVNYLIAYLKEFRKYMGFELYALSVQNEPAFAQPFVSCVYEPAELSEMIAMVGERMAIETYEDSSPITTKLFAPEDVGYLPRIKEYIQSISNSASARKYTDIIAVHGYKNDGVQPNENTPTDWKETHDLAEQMNKPLWMTETSGYANSWFSSMVTADGETKELPGALGLAQSIYNSLKFGNVSAWIWWRLAVDEEYWIDETLIYQETPHKFYYAAKSYFRYIRPGATRIEISANTDDLLQVAFLNREENTFTAVIINQNAEEIDLSINGDGLPQTVQKYYTSKTEDWVEDGMYNVSEPIRLQGNSVTTLKGEY
jgi:O-glycosyl hydrolase